MFLTLLLVTFVIALLVSWVVARVFDTPSARILERVIPEAISAAWHRYLKFAIIVVGISGGVRIWELEQYINPVEPGRAPRVLNIDRWTLEVYRTVIGTLQSVAWLLLVFFVVALIAFVIVRGQELRRERRAD